MFGLMGLASVLCIACGDDVAAPDDEGAVLPELIGDWAWQCSTGGFAGEQICAEASNLSQTWRFAVDSTFQWLRNDTIIETAPFDVRRQGPGIGGDSINVLYLRGAPTIFALEMPNDSSLVVQEQCFDCYVSTWVRIQ